MRRHGAAQLTRQGSSLGVPPLRCLRGRTGPDRAGGRATMGLPLLLGPPRQRRLPLPAPPVRCGNPRAGLGESPRSPGVQASWRCEATGCGSEPVAFRLPDFNSRRSHITQSHPLSPELLPPPYPGHQRLSPPNGSQFPLRTVQ